MQGKTLYTILISIIAVLALALTVLVIVLFTFNTAKIKSVEEDENQIGRVVPPEEQAEFKLYGDDSDKSKGDGVFNLKSTEKYPNSFIMVSISIIYDGGEENALLEERTKLIESYVSELKQATIEYFREKTFEDLQAADAMQKARDSLKDIYNKIIGNGIDKKIIIKIVFDKWIIQ